MPNKQNDLHFKIQISFPQNPKRSYLVLRDEALKVPWSTPDFDQDTAG